MQQLSSDISRKEQVLFDLICNVDEIRALKHELSILEVKQIEQGLKTLRSALRRKPQPNRVSQHFV